MDNEKEYCSDGDTSDEDFCPEQGAGSDLSEEATDDDVSDNNDEQDEVSGGAAKTVSSSSKRRKQLSTTTTKGKKVRKIRTNSKQETPDTADDNARRLSRSAKESNVIISGGGGGKEKDDLESDEEIKKRSDALWADFLSDVKDPVISKAKNNDPETSKNSSTKTKEEKSMETNEKTDVEDSKSSSSNSNEDKSSEASKKISITEILDFAGEEVRVEKTVNADSIKENKIKQSINLQPHSSNRNGNESLSRGPVKRPASGSVGGGGAGAGGLGSLLTQIGKKKKISVLEKSKLDWNSFKKDEGIEEELQTFNKGKEGYLERQDFLERTDLRQFEIEKNLRTTRRKY